MITVTIGFSREVRRPRRRTKIEYRRVQGVRLRFKSWQDAHSTPAKYKRLLRAVMRSRPGTEWTLEGYGLQYTPVVTTQRKKE